jgi:hypothetical protein
VFLQKFKLYEVVNLFFRPFCNKVLRMWARTDRTHAADQFGTVGAFCNSRKMGRGGGVYSNCCRPNFNTAHFFRLGQIVSEQYYTSMVMVFGVKVVAECSETDIGWYYSLESFYSRQ